MPGFKSTPVPVWGFDIETPLISARAVAPRPICYALSMLDPKYGYVAELFAEGDEHFWPVIEKLFARCAKGEQAIVGQTIHYDLSCIAVARPDLLGTIFAMYAAGMVFDVEIREKLINLSTHGKLNYVTSPDGAHAYVTYSLADLETMYLGIDRTREKEAEDAWRKNFEVLAGLKASQYPADAKKYVLDDALGPLKIFHIQDERVESPEGGPCSVHTQEFHTGVAFALRLATIQGMRVDPQRFHEIESEMAQLLSEEKLRLLIETGILRPSQPSRPSRNQPKDRAPDAPLLMTKAIKASIDTDKLRERIKQVAEAHGVPVEYTGKKKQVSTAESMIDAVAPFDAALAQYQERQSVQKIVTTYLPAMKNPDGTVATRVHPVFNVLIETFRTSSYGSDLFPSTNIQNQDPRTRGCFIPDGPDAQAPEGWVYYSVDVSGCELVSVGWKCKQLFGHSQLLDHLNTDGDAHGYLGAQIAYDMHPEFRNAVNSAMQGRTPTKADIYTFFKGCKKHEQPHIREFFKHYRKLAKPTGLGYWGGLGPATFIAYAKSTFGVRCTLQEATRFREIWRETYEEQKPYFDWITTNCLDPRNPVVGYNENGRPNQGHAYYSPMGAYRAGCTFTAAANGAGLQTPSAEACKLAFWEVSRATYDPSYNSPLYGTKVHAFIHDEVFGAIPRDQWMHERCQEICRIMSAAIGSIFTGAVIRTEPALMERWDKAAEPVYDKAGRLTIWQPAH